MALLIQNLILGFILAAIVLVVGRGMIDLIRKYW